MRRRPTLWANRQLARIDPSAERANYLFEFICVRQFDLAQLILVVELLQRLQVIRVSTSLQQIEEEHACCCEKAAET